tara:strand:- start:306 stop:563 length:258 start_codon:yes stop_codon:yes gene_type:complete
MDILLTLFGLAFCFAVILAIGASYQVGIKEKRRKLLDNYEFNKRMYDLDIQNKEDSEIIRGQEKRLEKMKEKIEHPTLIDKYWPF